MPTYPIHNHPRLRPFPARTYTPPTGDPGLRLADNPAGPIDVTLPAWSAALFEPKRYKVVHGGRASGKSWTVAIAILILLMGSPRPLRWVCMREVQKSLDESSKQVLEDMIEKFGWSSFWRVYRNRIDGANGSTLRFRGMNNVTARNVRSLEGIDGIWFEESQYMSRESAEILFPTMRKAGSEMWFTFNPRYREDAVWSDFCEDTRRSKDATVLQVNYLDNPWFPDESEQERIATWEDEPDRYAHIWLGEPDDEGAVRKVLPFALVQQCLKAWTEWVIPNNFVSRAKRPDAGLDVADTGADQNALVSRTGPIIRYCRALARAARRTRHREARR